MSSPPSKHKVLRHNARQYALQAVYQWQQSSTSMAEIESQFLKYHVTKKVDLEYFQEVIQGLARDQHEIDNYITPFLERPLSEIDPTELAILRIASFELAKRPDVPYKVIINEGLDLAKKFGSIQGFKFVNSILDRVARKLRINEINPDKK
jgi:N utilization substance protein B